jgi:hypothetical protein
MQYAGNNRDQDKCSVDTGTAVASSDPTVTSRGTAPAGRSRQEAVEYCENHLARKDTQIGRVHLFKVSVQTCIDGQNYRVLAAN